MLGSDLRIRRFTPAAERLLHLIPADVGRPITDIKLDVGVDHLDRLLAEVADTITPKELEVQDGTGRWYSLRIRPYRTLENKIDGAVLVFVDVDALKRAQLELRESEEHARLLIEGATGFALMLLDRAGVVTSWNVGAQRIFGYAESEILGKHCSTFFVPDDAGRCERELRIAETANVADDENWLVKKDGSRFWASGSTTALRDAKGDLRGFAKVVRDASEKRRLEEDLRARVAELAAADRRKDEFLSLLSHELRNPLAPLRHAVDVLTDPRMGDAERATTHAMIERQVAHLSRLVDDLLDVSRISQGKIQVKKRRVALAQVLQRASADVASHLVTREQTLSTTMPQQPVWLEADPVRLEQVFVNLLHNASKFSEPRTRITVTASVRQTAAGHEVVVGVEDQGQGIDPEVLPTIFDLFTQGENTAARSHGGLGIGLTLVKRLVELHGGSVEASSAGLGKGSRFDVRLPVMPETNAPADPADESLPPGDTPHRILVVDDNLDAAQSLAMLLRMAGHDVKVADSGAAALETADTFLPEVVIMDIAMPRMDGYQAARELRRKEVVARALLIALSGYGRDEDRRAAMDAGFDHHMTKPADAVAVRRLIARLR